MFKFKSLILDENSVNRALRRISYEIIEKNKGCENLCLIGIRTRGVPLAQQIASNIEKIEGVAVPLGKLDTRQYRDDIDVTDVAINSNDTDICFDITGKDVVLVDDVLHKGRTARAAIEALIKMGRPATAQLAVLVDRGHRELPIRADYVGKNIPTSRNEHISVKVLEIDGETSVELLERVN